MAPTAGQDRSSVPDWTRPMLAKPDGGQLRSGSQWAYEYKLDGYRAAMRIAQDGTTVLTSRNGIDFTDEFASLADPYLVPVVPAFTFGQLAADRLTPQNLLDRVAAAGLEGHIAKLRTSTYVPGQRPDSWSKHPLIQTPGGHRSWVAARAGRLHRQAGRPAARCP
ncbi:MAG TPA: hypothetical protein VGL80_16550 [Pseudonocardiaceae bacterium]